MTDDGRDIKVALIRNDKTQMWLTDRLREKGIEIDKFALSAILHGRRKGPKACAVIATAKEILNENDNTEGG